MCVWLPRMKFSEGCLLGLHCVLPYERAGGEVVSLVRVRVTVSDG